MEEISTTTAMDWITFVIAVAGFLMSLASWIRSLWIERKNLIVSMDFESQYKESFLSSLCLNATIAFAFENKSSNSIAVTFIEIQTKSGKKYRASLIPGYVAHKWRNEIDPRVSAYDRFVESAAFPVNICPFGAAYEYIVFSLPKNREWNDLSQVIVHTNRGLILVEDSETIYKFQEFLQKPLREKREKQKSLQQQAEIQ